MIETRQLQHVMAIAQEGSFTRAAAVLKMSQPALSLSISKLERALGVRLFERGRHGATATPMALALGLHGEQIAQILQNAELEAKLSHSGILGPLTIGGTPLALSSVIPAAIARLSSEAGHIAVNVLEATDDELVAGLLRYDFDVVISAIDLDTSTAGVEDIPLFGSRVQAVFRAGHPFTGRTRLSLRELKEHALALPVLVGTYGKLLEAIFLTAGETIPSDTIFANSFATLREVVLQSDCVTLIPEQIVKPDIERGLLAARELVGRVGRRTFGIRRVAARPLSPIAERFCAIMSEIGKDYDVS